MLFVIIFRARALWFVVIFVRFRFGAFILFDEFLSVIFDVNWIFSYWKFFFWNVYGCVSFF